MKYTIHGFSQVQSVRFGLNCEDLLLLRWFVDFKDSGKMKSRLINGKTYYWVCYEKMADDLPIVSSKKDTIYRKLKNMAELGILEKKTIKSGGTYSYYNVGKNYAALIDDSSDLPNEADFAESSDLDEEDFCENSSDIYPTHVDNHPSNADIHPNQTDIYPEQKILPPNKSTIQKPRVKDSDEFLLAELLFEHIQHRNPNIRKPNLDRWSSVFAYMLNVEKKSITEITDLISWIYKPDNFWCCRILTPDDLKRKYDKLIAIKNFEENQHLLKGYIPANSYSSDANIFKTQYGAYDLSGFELIGG